MSEPTMPVTTMPVTTMEATAPVGTVFAVDAEKRTIRGLAVPFGVEGVKGGQRFMFSRGTVRTDEPSRVKLWVGHDKSTAIGVAFELTDTDEGLVAAFRIARGARGDEALSMAEDGVWDGLSIGPSEGAKFSTRNGVHHAVDIPIHEISLTPAPVFGGARVRSVAFDAEKEPSMTETTTEPTTETPAPAVEFSAITEAITAGFATLANPQGPQAVAAGRATFTVDEATPYRFDGTEGDHDFSGDVIAALRGNSESKQRVETFMAETLDPVSFAVSTANVGDLNPPTNRPDMYVDRLVQVTPLWLALRKGSLTDNTPFVFPRFGSSAGLVSNHVEMVEPTPGSFTATKQTVTPSPLSGKVEIPREIIDAGGNPQVSQLIWREMERAYYAALEAKVSALLAASAPTAITLPAGSENATLVNALEAEYAALQFVDGGFRFDYAPTHAGLYKRLANAADTAGRKLLPIINPANANGTARSRFAALDVAGVTHLPTPTLGGTDATGVRKSYLLASEDVHAWASPPRELRFEYQVAHVDIGIWGYVATAISRLDGVRVINYNTATA